MTQPKAKIDWTKIPHTIFLEGDNHIAYRDPAGHYHDGTFRVFHTQVHREEDGSCYWYLGVTESRDLVNWTEPRILTPRDANLHFCGPGNIIRFGGKWLLCLCSYIGTAARSFRMESDDLVNWREPEIMMLKGLDVSREEMGRMIDPYFAQDKDEKQKWWCFYKQNGASISYTYDFINWSYFGRVDAGENACVLVDEDEYVLIHSPRNGFGIKRSKDLVNWRDLGLFTLGQEDWPWAQGRLTASHILDLRDAPEVGKYVMFFHGASKEGVQEMETHGNACLAIAWGEDLLHWQWPE